MYVGSDAPFSMNEEIKSANLMKFKYYGEQLFVHGKGPNSQYFEELLRTDLRDRGEEYRQNKSLRAVTDDNMLTEYKRPVSRLAPFYQWWASDKSSALYP